MTLENPLQVLYDQLQRIEAQNEEIKAILTRQATAPTEPPQDRYLSVQQAAELLNYTPGTLYAKHHRKEIPGALKRGAKLLFSEKALRDWIEAGRCISPEETAETVRVSRHK